MTKKKLSPWNNNLEFIKSLKPKKNFNIEHHPIEPNYFPRKINVFQQNQQRCPW